MRAYSTGTTQQETPLLFKSSTKSAHIALIVLEGEGRLDHVHERRQLLVAEHRLVPVVMIESPRHQVRADIDRERQCCWALASRSKASPLDDLRQILYISDKFETGVS